MRGSSWLAAGATLAVTAAAALSAWLAGARGSEGDRCAPAGAIGVPVVSRAGPADAPPARERLARAERRPSAVTETDAGDFERTCTDAGSLTCTLEGADELGIGDRTRVRVRLLQGARPWDERALDRDGRVTFPGLVEGPYSVELVPKSLPPAWLAATDPHSGSARLPVRLARGEDVERSLPVARAASVHGWVVDPEGVPLAGALVRLQATSTGRRGDAGPARSDERGYYAIDDLEPGTYRLQVVPPAGAGVAPVPERHALAAGVLLRVDLATRAEACSIAGRLVDGSGSPLAGVPVHAELPPAEDGTDVPYAWSRVLGRACTDEDGRYVLTDLPAAEVRVLAAHRLAARAFGGRSAFQPKRVGSFRPSPADPVVDAGDTVLAPRADG